MSDWAKIEKSRETRLWCTQILIPATLFVGSIFAPEIKQKLKDTT